tara:strand:- start:152 stop:298 length:147 start_codon:yes stop_codon:yes gene_type:complete
MEFHEETTEDKKPKKLTLKQLFEGQPKIIKKKAQLKKKVELNKNLNKK